jgi:hypothetical protein
MNMMRFYFLAAAFILSGKLFAQSFQPGDLIGVWQYGPDVTTAKMTFMKDNLMIMDDKDEKNKVVSYSFETGDSGYVLRMQPRDSDSLDVMYLKIKKLDQNLINLEIFKVQVFNKATNTWEEHETPPGTIMVLRRKR